MSILIKEVKDKKHFKQFISFPNKLYKGHQYFVPSIKKDEIKTLSKDKNPAFDYCESKLWLAYKNGKIAGRIAGIYNKGHIERWGKSQLRFGWIDFIEDENVASALLATVEKWAKEKKMDSVIGPLGFTDMDKSGMLVEGFEELGTMATLYNFPYYPKYMEKSGYSKDIDWVEYQIKIPDEPLPIIEKFANRVKKQHEIRLLEVKTNKELLPWANEMFHVLCKSYNVLYGFVPLSEKQILEYTKQYISMIDPDFIAIVLNESDKIIAFGITMPSFSKALQKSQGKLFPFGIFHLMKALKKNNAADLYLIGILPEYQGKGVGALIMEKIGNVFVKKGIKIAESNPELETNNKVQTQWKFFEKRQHKRRRCFIKKL